MRAGDVIFIVLLLFTIIWDIKYGYKAIALQLLGAFCLGTVVNSTVHPNQAIPFEKRLAVILFFSLITGTCYLLARRFRMEQ